MVVVYAVIALSLIFIFLSITQIFETIFFISRKSIEKVEVYEYTSKRAIIKKNISILLAKKKIRL